MATPLDYVESLAQVNKDHIVVYVLLPAILFNLPHREYRICSSFSRPEATCDSGYTDFSIFSKVPFRRTRASMFPATDRIDIPLWLSHMVRLPLSLYRWTMEAFLKFCGTTPLFQIKENSCLNFFVRWMPTCLNISAGILSTSGDFPLEVCLMAFTTSSKERG